MKDKKLKKETKPKKIKNENKKKNKVLQKMSEIGYTFKKKFMTNDVRTVLIVLILVGIFLGINLWCRSISLAQIDVTSDKLYTLTDTSKDALENIDTDIMIYVWGFDETSTTVDLLKQYKSVSSKIDYKILTTDNDSELISEYYLTDDEAMLLVIAGLGTDAERTDYIYESDMVTYDSSFNTVDITEQKITNSILKVMSDDIPVIYFLTGNEYDTSSYSSMEYLKQYLTSFGLYDTSELSTLNASEFEVPDDCDTLVIPTLIKDMNKKVSKKIIEYINEGGNILILNNSFMAHEEDLDNYQTILDLYGITLPQNYIIESSEYAVTTSSSYILGNVSLTHEITRELSNNLPVLCLPGTISFDTDNLTELGVSYTEILVSSGDATTTDYLTGEQDTSGDFILGAAVTKTVDDGVISNAVVFGTQASFSDLLASDLGYDSYPLFMFTEELIMNSIAYLTDKGEYYSISKLDSSSINSQTYTLTENQDYIVRALIASIPVAIIMIGTFVCIRRSRNK